MTRKETISEVMAFMRRDDAFSRLIPSRLRMLVSTIDEQQAEIERLTAEKAEDEKELRVSRVKLRNLTTEGDELLAFAVEQEAVRIGETGAYWTATGDLISTGSRFREVECENKRLRAILADRLQDLNDVQSKLSFFTEGTFTHRTIGGVDYCLVAQSDIDKRKTPGPMRIWDCKFYENAGKGFKIEPVNLRLDVNAIDVHPQEYMKSIGITYRGATPQTLGDQWWFHDCQGVPDQLPKGLSVMENQP